MRSIRNARVRIVDDDVEQTLVRMAGEARQELIVAAPFITNYGVNRLIESASSHLRRDGRVRVLTDLSPVRIGAGVIEPDAVLSLVGFAKDGQAAHLPRLHAKVFVADGKRAIVTSANLTRGGLFANHECGVAIEDEHLAEELGQRMSRLFCLAAPVSKVHLGRLCDATQPLRDAYETTQKEANRRVVREAHLLMQNEEDELIRAKLAGGAMHAIFARTIAYILDVRGPMRTVDLHCAVQNIHPDLCDDDVDRVIDGRHFGKKWKHAVRTAQQQLKQKDLIERDKRGVWRLLRPSSSARRR